MSRELALQIARGYIENQVRNWISAVEIAAAVVAIAGDELIKTPSDIALAREVAIEVGGYVPPNPNYL